MSTIKDIAALAGVSRGTVDRVLNKRGAVHPETEAKVLEIAKALNYKPNRAGIALAAQKKRYKFGVVMFGLGNPFFDDVISGFQEKGEELSSYNCSVVIRRISTFGVADQLNAIDSLLEEDINALCISPQNDSAIALKINELFDIGIPTVTFNTDIDHSKRIAYVGSNYYKCGQTAAGLIHLMTRGDVNLGIISGYSELLCHMERIEGFKSCLESYTNIKIVDYAENKDDDFISYEQTKKMLDAHPEINALFFVASGAYGGCKAVLGSAGRDIKIVTFDQTKQITEMLKAGVIDATICQQPHIQGSLPLEILFDYLMTGQSPKEEYNYTDIEIVIKESI